MKPQSTFWVSGAWRGWRIVWLILTLRTCLTTGAVGRLVACNPTSTSGTKSVACICNDGDNPVVRCINVLGMTQIPSDILPKVQSLAISRANITELLAGEFEEFEDTLRSLILSYMKISVINRNTFRNLYRLETLDLKYNALESLPKNTFQFLTSLISLDLSGNKLLSINKFAFLSIVPMVASTTLRVNLRLNKIKCECGIYQLSRWIKYVQSRSFSGNIQLDDFICDNHPQKLRYDQVSDRFYESCVGLPDLENSEATCRPCISSSTFYNCNLRSPFFCGKETRCMKRISYDSDRKLEITTTCESQKICAEKASLNKETCLREPKSLECTYCCTDDICGLSSGSVRTNDYIYILDYVSQNEGTFSKFLFDSNSPEHNQMARIITAKLQKDIQLDLKAGVDYFLERFEPDDNKSYKVLIKIALTVLNWVREKDIFTQLRDVFSNKNSASIFITMANLSKPHSVQRIKSGKCPSALFIHSASTSPTGSTDMWPETYAGVTVRLPCTNPANFNSKEYATRTCFQTSFTDATWGDANTSRCWRPYQTSKPSTTTRKITTSSTTTTTTTVPVTLPPDTSSTYNQREAQKVTSDILNFIQAKDSITSQEMHTMVSQLEKASSQENLKYQNVSESVLACVNGLIDVDKDTLQKSQTEQKTSSRMLSLIDNVGANAPLTAGKFEFSSPNLAVTARSLNSGETRDLVFAEVKSSDNKIKTKTSLTQGSSEPDDGYSAIVIPTQSIIKSLSDAQRQKLSRMTFSLHNDSKLFDSLQQSQTENKVTRTFDDGSDDGVYYLQNQVNSRILSASVPGVSIKNLDENITMTFEHKEKNSTEPECVYWDSSLKGGQGDWTDQGCGVVRSNDKSTTCGCNHLTNFALLMDIYQEGGGLSASDRKALSIISFIGCSISLLSLLLTLFTYSLFRKLRRDTPSKILINLCVALLISNLVFLVGMQDYTFDSSVACKIVAALLHYFMLASLTWMAVEAFYMYLALVLVFKTYFSNFILKLSLFGWGVPAIVVAVTLGVNLTDNYGLLGTGLCWLEIPAFYYAFVAPVCLILLLNCIAFGLVIRQLMNMSSAKLNSTDKYSTIQRLRGAIGVIILLGLTWLFAIFAIDSASVPIYYLFAIFNSLQGLFIFIFYCLFKTDALTSWKKFLCCFDTSDLPSSSASRVATFQASSANPNAAHRKNSSSSSSVNNTLSTSSTIIGSNRGSSMHGNGSNIYDSIDNSLADNNSSHYNKLNMEKKENATYSLAQSPQSMPKTVTTNFAFNLESSRTDHGLNHVYNNQPSKYQNTTGSVSPTAPFPEETQYQSQVSSNSTAETVKGIGPNSTNINIVNSHKNKNPPLYHPKTNASNVTPLSNDPSRENQDDATPASVSEIKLRFEGRFKGSFTHI